MLLTALQIRAFLPGATAYKRADERGLYLEIFPNGSKLWRLKYYVRLGPRSMPHPGT
jgi:hypothetical protein